MKKVILTLFLLPFISLLAEGGSIIDIKQPGEPEVSTEDLNLTDQDRHTSQNYVHEWLSHRTLKEECEKLDDPMACYGNGKTKFLGMDSTMVEMVGKAYTAIIGSMGGDIKTTEVDSQGNETQGSKQDYCKYIAVGTEAVGTMMQQMGQNNIQSYIQADTNQKSIIYGAANSHQERSKTAKVQGVGFGATTACYVTNIADIPANPSLILKMAGSGFLTAFYLHNSGEHERYAKEVMAIADKLPGKGDCNPITDKACYCAQPETANDPEYCLEYLHKKTIANTSYRVPCIDGNAEADLQCQCIGEESCFDKKYFTDINLPGFDSFLSSPLGKQFQGMSNGELKNGVLSSSTTDTAAKTTQALKQASGMIGALPNDGPLNETQKAQAALAEQLGLPKNLARALALQPVTPEVKSNIAKLKKQLNGKYAKGYRRSPSNRRSGNVMSFSGGRGLSDKNSARSSSYASGSRGKRKPSSSSGQTLKYDTESAAKAAEINNQPDTAIFEIISRRYQVSAWRRLELE